MTIDTDALKEVLERAKAFSELLPEDLAAAEAIVAAPTEQDIPEPLTVDVPPVAAPQPLPQVDESAKDIRAQIAEMTMPQKIKLALFGNSICRNLLILDTNRMIQQFVLKNPKLQQSEVEAFAKNPQLSEWVLRSIADSKTWMKSPSLKYTIVTNPKTPGDVSLKWLRYLNEPDLRRISKSKNLPQLIAVTAKKRLSEMEKK